MSDSATPWTTACQASLSFIISQSLLKFMSTELMMLSNYLISAALFSQSFPAQGHYNGIYLCIFALPIQTQGESKIQEILTHAYPPQVWSI